MMLDLDSMFLWLVAISCVLTAITVLRHYGLRLWGNLTVQGVLLLIVGLLALWRLPYRGPVAFTLWLVLVVLPAVASRQLARAVQRAQFARARRWAQVLTVCHPFDGIRSRVRYLEYADRLQRGDHEGARTIQNELAGTVWGTRALLEKLRAQQNWPGIIALFASRQADPLDPRLGPLYVRALGENGALSAMWHAYGKLPVPTRRDPSLRLAVLALSGRPELLPHLENVILAERPGIWPFWYATALLAAGQESAALHLMAALSQAPPHATDNIQQRMAHPPALRATVELDAAAQEQELRLQRSILEEQALRGKRPPDRMAWATIALGAVLLGIFASSRTSGQSEFDQLVQMGALLLPPERMGDELPWRVFAAGLLHFGPAHLLTNLLGLWVLGHRVERLFGSLALLFIFFTSSLGAMGLAMFTIAADVYHPMVIVGASGGIMGLVGGLASFAAMGYFAADNALSGHTLLVLGLIVIMQTALDLVTPTTSAQLHLSGAAVGALAALPFAYRFWLRR